MRYFSKDNEILDTCNSETGTCPGACRCWREIIRSPLRPEFYRLAKLHILRYACQIRTGLGVAHLAGRLSKMQVMRPTKEEDCDQYYVWCAPYQISISYIYYNYKTAMNVLPFMPSTWGRHCVHRAGRLRRSPFQPTDWLVMSIRITTWTLRTSSPLRIRRKQLGI